MSSGEVNDKRKVVSEYFVRDTQFRRSSSITSIDMFNTDCHDDCGLAGIDQLVRLDFCIW